MCGCVVHVEIHIELDCEGVVTMDTSESRVACMGGTKSQLTNEKFTALGSSPCVQFVNV